MLRIKLNELHTAYDTERKVVQKANVSKNEVTEINIDIFSCSECDMQDIHEWLKDKNVDDDEPQFQILTDYMWSVKEDRVIKGSDNESVVDNWWNCKITLSRKTRWIWLLYHSALKCLYKLAARERVNSMKWKMFWLFFLLMPNC